MMQPTTKLQTESTFPATLLIDGIGLEVRIKRMTKQEFDVFAEGFDSWSGPRGSAEETPASRLARETASDAWLRSALDYLSIVPGEYRHDGREITRGSELADIFGGRADVVPQALALILGENRLSEAQKKTYRLQLASLSGSAIEPRKTDSGDAPEVTAANVAEPGCVVDGDATARRSVESSGTTDRFVSEPVPSLA